MSESVRPSVSVHLLPALLAPGALAGGVAVVVDVLRATTVMVQALAAGAKAIVPCAEVDEARARAGEFPAGTAVLAGERQGLPIPGFDFGNSPDDFTREVCAGKTLVMTTTNGTRAILASLGADRLFVASFANRKATVDLLDRLVNFDGALHVVCSGTDGRLSLEDAMLAGAIVVEWADRRYRERPDLVVERDDGAELVARYWQDAQERLDDEPEFERALAGHLARGRGGRRVREIGLARDIDAAARYDRIGFAAEVLRDPLRVVAVPATG